MSNVIKKVFNTDKAEQEAKDQAQNVTDKAHNVTDQAHNLENKEEYVNEARDKASNLFQQGQHGAGEANDAAAGGAASTAAPGAAAAGAPHGHHLGHGSIGSIGNKAAGILGFGHHHDNKTVDAGVRPTESGVGVAGAGVPHHTTTYATSSQNVPATESFNDSVTVFPTRDNVTRTDSNVNVAAGNVDQDVQHLAPVVHQTHYRHEIEELFRQREHHIHQHHIQHHVQPVLDVEHATEQLHARIAPETTVREAHANTEKDAALLRSVAGNYKDTFTQSPIERQIVDKGEAVREIVHHHIHNVVQPVIQRDTHEYHRIRTTIPTTHITHEAPIVHESTAHQPIRKEDFIRGGGVLTSTIRTIDEAGVLNLGTHQRTVEGEPYQPAGWTTTQ